LIEFSFNFCTLLIHLSLFTSICKVPHAPIYPAIPYVQSLETKRKEKEMNNENERKMKRKEKG